MIHITVAIVTFSVSALLRYFGVSTPVTTHCLCPTYFTNLSLYRTPMLIEFVFNYLI